MHSKIIAFSAFAALASASPHLYARQDSNATTSAVAAQDTGIAPSGTYSSGGTFTIPAPIEVPSDVKAAADKANAALALKADAEITNVGRFNQLLTVDGAGTELLDEATLQDRVVFNFNKAPAQGEGGRFQLANVKNFPILAKQGLATAVAFLNPCGMNSPHIHPRAAEWLTVIQGNLTSGFILENGFVDPDANGRALASEVQVNIGPFEGTLFPQGSIHYQFNDNCEPATFIATLSSEDPGTSQVAQNLFFLDDGVVDVVLGENIQIDGSNIAEFRERLPANLIQAMETCLDRCSAS